MKALDVSVYSVSYFPTVEDFRTLRAQGFDLMIVGLWTGNKTFHLARDVLAPARESGMLTAAYLVPTASLFSARLEVQKAREAAKEEWDQLSFVAVDVELSYQTQAMIEDAVAEILRLGQRPFIYTSSSSWRAANNGAGLGDTFSTLPLWDAHYIIDPRRELSSFPNDHPAWEESATRFLINYGGWYYSVGHQFLPDVQILPGFSADLNVFRNTFRPADLADTVAPTPLIDSDTVLSIVRDLVQNKLTPALLDIWNTPIGKTATTDFQERWNTARRVYGELYRVLGIS